MGGRETFPPPFFLCLFSFSAGSPGVKRWKEEEEEEEGTFVLKTLSNRMPSPSSCYTAWRGIA